MAKPLISVIVPVYNEEANIVKAYEAITREFAGLPDYDVEIIFTDNHSTDRSFALLTDLAHAHPHVKVLRYARNFGFHRSILTGYRYAKGDAAIQIDCDLEDPTSVFPDFLRLWREGHDVVVGVREGRNEGWHMIKIRRVFYRLLNQISDSPHVMDAGDFRLTDRHILDQLQHIDDADPYVRGLISELANRQGEVRYTRHKREHGESKFPFWQLVRLAMNGIFSYSTAPLRVATYMGIAISLVTALLTAFTILARLFLNAPWPSGFATTTVLILFGISLNAIFLGIIGEYVGRIYNQVRRRPTVIIERALNIERRADYP
ncbi:MAG: glycosyltransferase family 2 protein [Pseudomonadota bacterium]